MRPERNTQSSSRERHLIGLPSAPRRALTGDPNGIKGDKFFLAELAVLPGVASRSNRLIKEAISLVATSRIEITPTSAITKYIPNSIIKEGENENPYHRSLRESPGVLSC